MIAFLFNLLFFLIPLIFFPKTSELFEFNKMVTVYIFTILITSAWIIKSISQRKIIFRRTMLDIPILLFVLSQAISTALSIDLRTSIFGYYSRFNGGLLSSFSYVLLYWAYVSNMQPRDTKQIIRNILIVGTVISLWGVLEHFGKSPTCLIITGKLNATCFVQNLQNRVFATFGQPNWMAAYLVAIMPLAWAAAIPKYQILNTKYPISHALNLIFYIALLFTKSRSGLLGFAIAFAIFWGLALIIYKKKVIKQFLLTTCYILLATIIIGTPFNSLTINHRPSSISNGGTESGDIRKIVWQGAIEIWKHYPLFGTGVETFAHSYYQFRPKQHNLTSEWNYLYNKAHNEFLNYIATTGIVGLSTYLLIIIIALYQISNVKFLINLDKSQLGQLEQLEIRLITIALLAGYISILVTNFFGFSVVPTSLLFFLFPALALTLYKTHKIPKPKFVNSYIRKFSILFALLITSYLLLITARYWLADYYYAQENYEIAVRLSPSEPVFQSGLALKLAFKSIDYFDRGQVDIAQKLSRAAENHLELAALLAPRNVKLMKAKANALTDLSIIDARYITNTISTLEYTQTLAPTDPTIPYLKALAYARLKQENKAIESLKQAISLKVNYKKARLMLAALYKNRSEFQKAREQYQYILDYIAPDDIEVKEILEKLV